MSTPRRGWAVLLPGGLLLLLAFVPGGQRRDDGVRVPAPEEINSPPDSMTASADGETSGRVGAPRDLPGLPRRGAGADVSDDTPFSPRLLGFADTASNALEDDGEGVADENTSASASDSGSGVDGGSSGFAGSGGAMTGALALASDTGGAGGGFSGPWIGGGSIPGGSPGASGPARDPAVTSPGGDPRPDEALPDVVGIVTPEPASAGLLAIGSAFLAGSRLRRRRRA